MPTAKTAREGAGFALVIPLLAWTPQLHAARFLFDAGHAETAGNADWIVDADVRNISWTSSGTFTLSGSESNAQRIPTPAASGIIANTPETYWSGGISAWAVDLVKRGHEVQTLPAGTRFTFGTTNAQDLANYDVVVVCEPNIVFTMAEKQALLNFVADGGGLFLIADHSASDRNSDGQDSVTIFNDLLTNNGLTNNPFGITFPSDSYSGISPSSSRRTDPTDPIIFGPVGTVTSVKYSAGNRFKLDLAKNPTLLSHVWFGTAAGGFTNRSAVASLRYGAGRVVVCGDSSVSDDGTGDPGDTLYYGYTDPQAQHRAMILNASEWLAAAPGGDADADGMHSSFEQAHGFNPYLAADANEDPDGDGETNLREHLAGTDPHDAASIFRITRTARAEGGFLLEWLCAGGNSYYVLSKDDFADPNWTTNSLLITATSTGTTNYLDATVSPALKQRFYQVIIAP